MAAINYDRYSEVHLFGRRKTPNKCLSKTSDAPQVSGIQLDIGSSK